MREQFSFQWLEQELMARVSGITRGERGQREDKEDMQEDRWLEIRVCKENDNIN